MNFLGRSTQYGTYPQYSWDFPEEIPELFFWKDLRNALRVFPGIPLESTAGIPQTHNSRRLRLPEHVQNSLVFVQKRFIRGLSDLVMEFPAVLRASLIKSDSDPPPPPLLSDTEALRKQFLKNVLRKFCWKLRPVSLGKKLFQKLRVTFVVQKVNSSE